MRCPRDPPARPLPGTLIVREQTARTLIHIDPLTKLNIGSPWTGIFGEHIVPGVLQTSTALLTPADPRPRPEPTTLT